MKPVQLTQCQGHGLKPVKEICTACLLELAQRNELLREELGKTNLFLKQLTQINATQEARIRDLESRQNAERRRWWQIWK